MNQQPIISAGQFNSGPNGTFKTVHEGNGKSSVYKLTGDCITDESQWTKCYEITDTGESDASYSEASWPEKADAMFKALTSMDHPLNAPPRGGCDVYKWEPTP